MNQLSSIQSITIQDSKYENEKNSPTLVLSSKLSLRKTYDRYTEANSRNMLRAYKVRKAMGK